MCSSDLRILDFTPRFIIGLLEFRVAWKADGSVVKAVNVFTCLRTVCSNACLRPAYHLALVPASTHADVDFGAFGHRAEWLRVLLHKLLPGRCGRLGLEAAVRKKSTHWIYSENQNL